MTLVTLTARLSTSLWARLAELATSWHSRQRASLYLEAWPDAMLKDIGIARSEIHHVTRYGRTAPAAAKGEAIGDVER